MTYSNQFPVQDKIKKEPISINQRANIIWSGLKENLPRLYNQIMKGKRS